VIKDHMLMSKAYLTIDFLMMSLFPRFCITL